jgi:hypothetical protein
MAKIEYNKYSNTLKKLAGKLPPKQVKTFVLTSKKWKKDPEGESRYDSWVGIGPKRIPNECTILDPETHEPVLIGYVKGYNEDGTTKLGEIVFHAADGGEINLIGGNADHEKLYRYLRLCDYNESNPRRDTNKQFYFKEINPIADEEEKGRKAMVMAQAMALFSAMTSHEKRNFCEQHQLAHIGTDDQINARVAKYIQDYPETFINLMDDSSEDILRKIQIAWKDKKVIKNNHKQAQWEWADAPEEDKVIMQYPRDFRRGGTVDKKLLDWIMDNPRGMDVVRKLEEKLEEVEV